MNDNRVKELEKLVIKHQIDFYQIEELVGGYAGKEFDGEDYYPKWAIEVMKIAVENTGEIKMNLADIIDEKDPALAWAKGPRCIKCSHPCSTGIFPDKGRKKRAWQCMACDVIQITHQFLCEEGTGKYYRTTYLPIGLDLEEIRNGRL